MGAPARNASRRADNGTTVPEGSGSPQPSVSFAAHRSHWAGEAVAGTAAYRDLIDRLKQRIRESHARAARTLDTELVMLYWSIGREIIDQQRADDAIFARVSIWE